MPTPRPVIVTSSEGVEVRYNTVRDVQRALNLHPPTVHRALKDGKPLKRWDYRGWSFRYADEGGALTPSPPAPLAQVVEEVEAVVERVEVEAPAPKLTWQDFLEQARVKPR